MRNQLCAATALLVVLGHGELGTGLADELHCSLAAPIANGSMFVCHRQSVTRGPTDLLIHFHGPTNPVQQAFSRSDLSGVLVVVNFPGLSTAYSQPFESDDSLFQQILDQAKKTINDSAAVGESIEWRRVSVSSFSAGYGAVRQILKTPKYFARIDAVVAADSIYAGLQKKHPDRQVDEQNMRDFLRFASLAANGTKSFVISHSAQPTPYASTTETADYLLSSLRIGRQPDTTIRLATMKQSSHASRGRFVVIGFEGQSGKAHMQHLHNIDLIWKRMAEGRSQGIPTPSVETTANSDD